jgi:spermidine synthase
MKWIRDKWAPNGAATTVKVVKEIESYHSEYQKIDVYETAKLGKMLLLDDIIMLTEFDEFAYHEMIAHPALHVHPKVKNALVIGGGDGGTVREILKHPDIQNIHVCEIDEEVILVCKKHFPALSSGFDDPKVKIFFEDGAVFVQKRKNEYDLIIVDSSDPIGPAEVLFKERFYRNMFDALTEDGITVTQSEGMFFDKETIRKLFTFNRSIFPILYYYFTLVPTYPSGTIGFSFCSKKYHPVIDIHTKKEITTLYYTPDIHKASFVLPKFMEDVVKSNVSIPNRKRVQADQY